jgi:hypothetical protein
VPANRQLRRVGVGLDHTRGLPLGLLSEPGCRLVGPGEVRDPAPRAREPGGALVVEQTPDALSDLLLGFHVASVREVAWAARRCWDMEHGRDPIGGYLSRVVGGLVACAVVAVTLHADVAALAMLGPVLLVVLAAGCLILRD